MDKNRKRLPKTNTTDNKVNAIKTKIDSIFLRENINRFSEQLFRNNVKLFSRYNVERRWPDIVKNDTAKRPPDDDSRDKNELSYWTYSARKINRAVSEPNLHTMRVLGTRVLQNKSNSFHNLGNVKRKNTVSADSFKPKLVTWLYVTRAQCTTINFTRTDKDLLNVFGDMFQWKTSNETRFMPRLFADIAKYCKKSEFTDDKMSTLLGIYHYTHLYNRSSRIVSFEEVYHFFKELIVRHSVFNLPDHVKLFAPEESKLILAQFLNKYLVCLPLIRHMCIPSSTLRVPWDKKEHTS